MGFMPSTRVIILFWVVVLALAGCGGGGGGSDQNGTPNLAPIANAGANRLVQQGSMVELDGSSSSDQDGQIVSYNWVQTRGPGVPLNNAGTVSPNFIAPQTSTREELEFLLTVQDNNGAQSSDTVTITVNLPPIADAGADQTKSLGNPSVETVTLTGIAGDSDGAVIAHQWVQTGGPTVVLTGPDTPTASFTAPATTAAYTFSYTVTDNDGAQATDSVSVYVTRIIFSDTFSDNDGWQTRWDTIDDTNNGAEWLVTPLVNAQLRQNNNLETLNLNPATRAFFGSTSYHSGTFAVLRHSVIDNAPSYRFSVDIKPLPDDFGSRQGNALGIMFRYNPNNYYRVSMSARYGYTRFEKRQNGVFQTLAVNAIGYVDNQIMTMTAEVNGDTIIVWINGDPVFALVDDDPIPPGTVALFCQDRAEFDNVLVTENPLQPLVVLSTPLAYSVPLTRDDGNTLPVEAIVLNKPDGGSVEFSLFGQDDDSEIVTFGMDLMGGVYLADFFDLAAGEYDVMAVLTDDTGREWAHDINSTVGIGGDYYVTVGNSITNGIGDQFPGNNDSADGRVVGIQGYQAGLSDRLTATTVLPQIVFNEGIGGDRASDLIQRIDSILERHPGANRVLLMIGTNDSSDGVSANDFEAQVLETVAKMNGRQVWLAKPMPTFIINTSTLNTTRNNLIQEYNSKVDLITSSNPSSFPGPDFYTVFSNNVPIEALYTDHLHPNDAGYIVMADQWHDVLIQ